MAARNQGLRLCLSFHFAETRNCRHLMAVTQAQGTSSRAFVPNGM